ncbi:hypothetical protein BY458DRAFT_429208 [Sporodiniella umbellata]|nr:hypothetical protein BY458DRAFT_429208 [Sporodiniella umbellata]
MGAISFTAVVNIPMRGNVNKREVVKATNRKALGDQTLVPNGTSGTHYTRFIVETMKIFSDM